MYLVYLQDALLQPTLKKKISRCVDIVDILTHFETNVQGLVNYFYMQ